ncbi:MAG: hypothetical protein CMM31_07790, partial [Rhodospirillaceae bacterium]|nr:hypothetical protein [Rhodospirillaceae bacterium]
GAAARFLAQEAGQRWTNLPGWTAILAVNILGAALRLGLIGHVDSQTILGRVHPVIEEVFATEPPPLDQIHAYAPAADIAMMRHETQESRLFYN